MNPSFTHLKGGRLIWGVPSASDPVGDTMYVECDKHPGWIKVSRYSGFFDLNQSIESPQEAAQTALNQCKGCIDDAAQLKTRWPEGAEL